MIGARLTRWAFGMAATLVLAAAPAQAWTEAAVQALEREGVRVREVPVEAGGSLEAVFFVAAPPRVARDVLWDSERFPAFMPHTDTCRTLDDQGEERLVEQIGGQGPFRFRLVTRRRLSPGRVSWHRVAGDLRENRGEWVLEEAPGGTVVTYRAHVVPDGPVPGIVVGYVQRQGLKAMLRAVRGRIEQQASRRG